MKCAHCGTALHVDALYCWNCGQETPNNTEEVKERFRQEAEAELLQDSYVSTDPESAPPRGKKVVCVYRQVPLGRRLAGWLDEYGNTYKSDGLHGPHRRGWSVDEQGQIYLVAGENRGLVGWIEGDAVYAQYAHAKSGIHYVDRWWFYTPPPEFEPELAFRISKNGMLYRPSRHNNKIVGKVEGAPDIYMGAGLALTVLM